VNCPTRASGHGKVRDRGFLLHVHYRDCEGAWDCWIADICSKQEIAAWIMSQTIGPDAHFHLDDTHFVFRREKAHSVFAAICGEHEIMLFRYKRYGHTSHVRDRAHVLIFHAVDHIERVIGRMRDVQKSETAMHCYVIETALAL